MNISKWKTQRNKLVSMSLDKLEQYNHSYYKTQQFDQYGNVVEINKKEDIFDSKLCRLNKQALDVIKLQLSTVTQIDTLLDKHQDDTQINSKDKNVVSILEKANKLIQNETKTNTS